MTRALPLVLLITILAPGRADADRYRARAALDDGRAALDKGDDDAALAAFEQAIDFDVDLIAAYREAIPLWIRTGELASLRKRLERVTVRHPTFAEAWYALGYAYRRAGRSALAVMAYQSYISLRPGEAAPYFGLAMAHKGAGDPARAEAAFRRYVDRERDPVRADFAEQAERELFALVVARYRDALVGALTSTHSGQ